MTCSTSEIIGNRFEAINEILKRHQHQVSYGNLRSELTHWDTDGGTDNLAIVYEVPGGSTNQINITYHYQVQKYCYIGNDSINECTTSSIDEVTDMVHRLVEEIPAIRHRRLLEDIDRWAKQGMQQRDLFQQITKLLQIEDLRGGTITMPEMKAGIAYILQHYRSAVQY